ncbi:MAG: extracellular solute-binding protein, partial [Pseudomonadota bacterium]
SIRQWVLGSFDSLNPFTVKGESAAGLATLTYDPLMAGSLDEPSTEYCLICEWVNYPSDYSSVTFKLREEARFHDGKPITAEDVVFTLGALKKAHPQYAFYYKNVVKAEKTGEREVTFSFDVKGNRELPQIVGQLRILPKHYWTAEDDKGEVRDLMKSTMSAPVASGPYRVGEMKAGRSIRYDRVEDYWAKDLPVMKGQYNFDQIEFIYSRERTGVFEEFKTGKLDIWAENSANAWATQYDIPAVEKGLLIKEPIPHKRVAPMQAFVINQRRVQFQDPRVRRAFNLVFNFEAANKSLFYEQYIRVGSFFDNSELKSSGLPTGQELEILESVRDLVPPEVFTTEWKNPVAETRLAHRDNMREAVKLLREAGWKQNTGVLTDDRGREFQATFLIQQPNFKRVVMPYVEDLKKIGIKADVRVVDTAQYKRLTDEFDYDIIVGNFGQSHSPGNEQRGFWGSEAADRNGSLNAAGIKDPAVDKLIDRIVFAKDREELVAATRALDRVLLWGHHVVPQWHYPYERYAYWDKFGRPENLPSQTAGVLRTWWVEPDKEAKLKDQMGM